jgi:hypothetical protein
LEDILGYVGDPVPKQNKIKQTNKKILKKILSSYATEPELLFLTDYCFFPVLQGTPLTNFSHKGSQVPKKTLAARCWWFMPVVIAT